MGERRRWEC